MFKVYGFRVCFDSKSHEARHGVMVWSREMTRRYRSNDVGLGFRGLAVVWFSRAVKG